MIQTADAPYRKKKHYYAMLDTEIRSAVDAYIGSIDADILTVLEKLDIKEFNKSRRTNAMFSNFARGRLQQKLMSALNWKGYDFAERTLQKISVSACSTSKRIKKDLCRPPCRMASSICISDAYRWPMPAIRCLNMQNIRTATVLIQHDCIRTVRQRCSGIMPLYMIRTHF